MSGGAANPRYFASPFSESRNGMTAAARAGRAGYRVVRRPRKDGELGGWTARAVPTGVPLSTAEHSEELQRVAGPHRISIRPDDQDGHLQPGNSFRPVVNLLHWFLL